MTNIARFLGLQKPFQVLKDVRDGRITSIPPAAPYSEPPVVGWRRALLERLVNAGAVQTNADSRLSLHPIIPALFAALQVRLSDLASYSPLSVVCNPRFGESRREGAFPDVFVMAAFRSELRAIHDDHIRPVVEAAGLTCVRGDDVFGAETIIHDIYTLIKHARIAIADCTDRNPNVFYEIGIAHTIGIPVILVSRTIDDVPFDLRHERVIVYEYTPPGMKQFEAALREALQFETRSTQ